MNDPLIPWLAAQCPGADPQQIAAAMAVWLERQERDTWLSPAYRITAQLIRSERDG